MEFYSRSLSNAINCICWHADTIYALRRKLKMTPRFSSHSFVHSLFCVLKRKSKMECKKIEWKHSISPKIYDLRSIIQSRRCGVLLKSMRENKNAKCVRSCTNNKRLVRKRQQKKCHQWGTEKLSKSHNECKLFYLIQLNHFGWWPNAVGRMTLNLLKYDEINFVCLHESLQQLSDRLKYCVCVWARVRVRFDCIGHGGRDCMRRDYNL